LTGYATDTLPQRHQTIDSMIKHCVLKVVCKKYPNEANVEVKIACKMCDSKEAIARTAYLKVYRPKQWIKRRVLLDAVLWDAYIVVCQAV